MRENISTRKMGRKVMTLYFAVFMEFGTCPDFSLPLSISMARGPLWPLPFFDSLWPFLLPCRFHILSTLSTTSVYCQVGVLVTQGSL